MARSLDGTTNRLKAAVTFGQLHTVGTIFLRLKPVGWASGDSTARSPWDFRNSASGDQLVALERSASNVVAVGVNNITDFRISISDAGIFADGVWANHLFTWSDTANTQEYFVNGVSKGTSAAAFTLPPTNNVVLGAVAPPYEGVQPAPGHYAVFARWDRILDAGEIATLESTGNPECVPTGLIHYVKILGNDSPEPDEIGSEDLALIGAPAQVTHPTVGSCDVALTVNPSAIAETVAVPSPAVDMVLGVAPTAIAADVSVPSPVLTMATMGMAPSVIAADASVPTIGVNFITRAGVRITIGVRLAEG